MLLQRFDKRIACLLSLILFLRLGIAEFGLLFLLSAQGVIRCEQCGFGSALALMRKKGLDDDIGFGDIEFLVEFGIAFHLRECLLTPQLADGEIIEHNADNADQRGEIIQTEHADQRDHCVPCAENDVQRAVIRPCQISEHDDCHAEQNLENAAGQDCLRLVKRQIGTAQQIEHCNILFENREETYNNAQHQIAEKCTAVYFINVVHLHPAVFIVGVAFFKVYDFRLFFFKRIDIQL